MEITVNGYDVYYRPADVWEIAKKSNERVVLAENEHWTKVIAWMDVDNNEVSLSYYFDFIQESIFIALARNAEECEMFVEVMYRELFGYKD